ncbi:MAG: hypothetical protein JRJ14_10065 [Deltaproteobacteria bacterium]|nr:hypothetical protein [Deltaproteobacteria bacterium]
MEPNDSARDNGLTKISWQGKLVSVQPRIRLQRSFDQRNHSYLGYALRVRGVIDDHEQEFIVGIGKRAQAKHGFRVGDVVFGQCLPVEDNRTETVEFYKVSKLKFLERQVEEQRESPLQLTVPPDLPTYRQRRHQRLDARTYEARCKSCIWGCKMAVEMIIDQWNPGKKKYRSETFCYGPKSCSFYKAGPTRKVPGRKGMSWTEEDWVDEDATSHRSIDE